MQDRRNKQPNRNRLQHPQPLRRRTRSPLRRPRAERLHKHKRPRTLESTFQLRTFSHLREHDMAEQHAASHAEHEHDHKPHGWRRWVYATNHKDIGTMYLVFACIMFFIGGAMAMVIRLELFKPGMQIVDPQLFNSMTTMHALMMIFGAVMPAWTGLANWMVPLQVGAPDMALPRLNNFSFWILPFAFFLLLSSLFVPGGAPAGGWTMYPPLVLQTNASFPMLIFTIHMMGVSSILGANNNNDTNKKQHTPGMTLLRMPLFVWT